MAIHVVIYRYTFIDQTTKSECLFLAHPVKLIKVLHHIHYYNKSVLLIDFEPTAHRLFFLMAMLQKRWILQFP